MGGHRGKGPREIDEYRRSRDGEMRGGRKQRDGRERPAGRGEGGLRPRVAQGQRHWRPQRGARSSDAYVVQCASYDEDINVSKRYSPGLPELLRICQATGVDFR